MDDIKLTGRLTTMLTETGAVVLLTIIKATRTINVNGRPIKRWSVDWSTGRVFTCDHFEAEKDAEGSPNMIGLVVTSSLPPHMILDHACKLHQELTLHEGAVWSVEDLVFYDLRTFQIVGWTEHPDAKRRVCARLKAECPARYDAFIAAPDSFIEGKE